MISYNHPSGTAAGHTHITYLSTSHILIHSHAPSTCTTAGYLQSRRGMRRRGQVVPPLLPTPTSLYTLTYTHTHSLSLSFTSPHSPIQLANCKAVEECDGGAKSSLFLLPLPTQPPPSYSLYLLHTPPPTASYLQSRRGMRRWGQVPFRRLGPRRWWGRNFHGVG